MRRRKIYEDGEGAVPVAAVTTQAGASPVGNMPASGPGLGVVPGGFATVSRRGKTKKRKTRKIDGWMDDFERQVARWLR